MSAVSTSLPLQTLGENGKPPAKRVKDAHDAREICSALVYASRDRARFNAKVKGMLDGNPPYNAVTLRQNAQSYRANVNFREGKALLSAAMVPFYDLFAGSRNYCEVKLYLDNPDDQEAKSGIVTEEFDCLLKKYKKFIFNINGMLHDFVAFGKGFLMFPNQWGWHFQRVSFNRVFVSDGADASVEEVEMMVVREKMQLHTLWRYIKEKDTARSAGWNTGECAEAIRQAMPEDSSFVQSEGNESSYLYVQQRMRDRDILYGTKQATVQVCHLLMKEFDGTITHMIVQEESAIHARSGSGSSSPQLNEKFLFEKTKKFKNMRESLSAFFFETLDGSWNGANGLGHEIYSQMEIKNRLICKGIDNTFLTSGFTLQAKTANGAQKASIVQIGDINVIPDGFDVVNTQFVANSQSLIGMNQLLDQTISSNTGVFKSKMEKPAGNPRTAKEIEIQYENATVLSNSAVSRLYGQFDPFYEELYRRVTYAELIDSDKSEEAEAVREFRKRCKKRGVTTEDMRSVESVRACRNIGNGSQAQRRMALQRFEPYVALLPESGKQTWLELLVASEFGQSMVAQLVPPRDKQLLPNDQQAMAMLENAALKDGAPVAWTPTQNNVIHATEHLKAMAGAAESLQQGADPMTVLGFLEIAGPHVQLHMDKLATDPSRKAEHKMLSQQFGQVASFTDQLAAQVQEQVDEQQQAQQAQAEAQAKTEAIAGGTDPEIAIKQAQAQFDMTMKEAKTRQQLQLKSEAHRQKLASKDLDLAQKLSQRSKQEVT